MTRSKSFWRMERRTPEGMEDDALSDATLRGWAKAEEAVAQMRARHRTEAPLPLFSSRSLVLGVDVNRLGYYPELQDLAWRFRRAADEFAHVVDKLERFHQPAESLQRHITLLRQRERALQGEIRGLRRPPRRSRHLSPKARARRIRELTSVKKGVRSEIGSLEALARSSVPRQEMVQLALRRLEGDLKLMGARVETVRSSEARRRSYAQRRGRVGRVPVEGRGEVCSPRPYRITRQRPR